VTSHYKYFIAYSLPAATFLSIFFQGIWSYATLIESFLIIPLLELILSPDTENIQEENNTSSLRFYDILLYLMVPVQFALLLFYLITITTEELKTYELIGMTLSMGIQCGAIGINVAHELGHRKSAFERFLAKSLLLSSLYMHFIIEHNHGHHRNVATPNDPATARAGEPVYFFWFRSIIGTFVSAWRIEGNLQNKMNRSALSLKNQMVQVILIELSFLFAIYLIFGKIGLSGFLASSLIGILLLETVNYIEHYGLQRKLNADGKYERVQPWHSWNSDFPIGRIVLFELTRHSDHHYKASKKYQTLKHLEQSPQLPTGYPGMMLLSLIPPLWFKIVTPLLKQVNQSPQ
jgi:alkane 1-monooxygenase